MQKIGKYELLREVGRGATSTVFLANDPFSKRKVAIKVAAPEVLKNPKRGKLYTHLFLNEASFVGKLSHPHIVQIYDAVVTENTSYIVMEYLEGGTLEKYCSPSNLLPLDQVIEIIFKCTRALDFAYRMGVTHRDIKPANILLTGKSTHCGDIKISDFGAAIVDNPARTLVGGVGSPAYMSPEQVRELPLNHQTDIYSLGVVMYQLLTGHLPFRGGSNYSIVYQIINTDAPPPSSLRKQIPPAIDAIVMRALQKETIDRYSTWMEFAHDLSEIAKNQSLVLPSENLSESQKFEILRAIPFFEDFSDVELWEILGFSEWRTIEPETYLLREGEAGDFFCILVEGELQVLKNRHVLSILTAGDCFGEMSLLKKGLGTRVADVKSLSESTLIHISNTALKQASEACQMHFYLAFFAILTARLSLANKKLADPQIDAMMS